MTDRYADLRDLLDLTQTNVFNRDDVRALLADYDRMRDALQSIADCCDEDHCARDYASRQTEIRGIARAAVAQEQGDSDGRDPA